MTVSSQETKILYEPDGAATVFYVTFPVRDAADVECLLARDGMEVVYTSGVTIQGIEQGKAAAHFVEPPPAGSVLVIRRNTRRVQESDYPVAGRFPAKVLEQDLDRLVMMIQELAEGLSRALKVPVSEILNWDDLVKALFEAGVKACACADASCECADAAGKYADLAETLGGNAVLDVWALSEVVSGSATRPNAPHPDGTVTTRTGVVIKTLQRALLDLVVEENSQAIQDIYDYFKHELAGLDIFPNLKRELVTDTDGFAHVYALVDRGGQIPLGVLEDGSASLANLIFMPLAGHGGVRKVPAAFGVADSARSLAWHVNARGDVVSGNAAQRAYPAPAHNGLVAAVADEEGFAACGVTERGHFQVGDAAACRVFDEEYALAFADEDGFVALGIRRDGSVVIGSAAVEPEAPGGPEDGLCSLANQRTDYMHIFSYGQSLSRGSLSTPVLSVVQPYRNVTFASGVLRRTVDAGHDFSSFKPLAEEAVSVYGETPVSGALNGLSERIAGSGDVSEWRFAGTAPGEGGRSLEQLWRGSIYWDGMMDQVEAGVAASGALGCSYSVWAMCWIQGEGNSGDGIEEYRSKLVKLKNDFAVDVAARTGQNFRPPVFSYQVAAHRWNKRDHNNVAIAQWRASLADPDILLATPIYHIPHGPDHLHLTNDSSLQLGRYFGRAMHRTLIEGVRWRPLQPRSVLWQGRVVDVAFHVPVGELRFDAVLVAAAPNGGFDVWAQGVCDPAAVVKVEIVGVDRLRVMLSRAPKAGDVLTYARGRPGDPETGGPVDGPRGNLRDQAGDADNYMDSGGVVRYMHNWCVMFQYEYGKPNLL